jgi:hypothetical protein
MLRRFFFGAFALVQARVARAGMDSCNAANSFKMFIICSQATRVSILATVHSNYMQKLQAHMSSVSQAFGMIISANSKCILGIIRSRHWPQSLTESSEQRYWFFKK